MFFPPVLLLVMQTSGFGQAINQPEPLSLQILHTLNPFSNSNLFLSMYVCNTYIDCHSTPSFRPHILILLLLPVIAWKTFTFDKHIHTTTFLAVSRSTVVHMLRKNHKMECNVYFTSKNSRFLEKREQCISFFSQLTFHCTIESFLLCVFLLFCISSWGEKRLEIKRQDDDDEDWWRWWRWWWKGWVTRGGWGWPDNKRSEAAGGEKQKERRSSCFKLSVVCLLLLLENWCIVYR